MSLKYTILRKIEEEAGRLRSDDKYAARPIDLDILLYASEIINEPGLILPDPDIGLHPFLFVPLLDLEPHIQLPGMDAPLHSCCSDHKRKTLQKDRELSKHLKERFLL
ncbi:MAG: 2-amino-4-hydroxy-6-hydroxymethyldihydropteridine diphosphokinase [Candidatus Hydrogenedens sp.]|jgi:7,8-dihydro-6-hydroxymethylpterin-pyrophosphokinase|nr:2-amino-4-hydroxy-6-hydroxymethyldihydropteridine diphosphokinase [Candidatus Hydrogenedens sp.]